MERTSAVISISILTIYYLISYGGAAINNNKPYVVMGTADGHLSAFDIAPPFATVAPTPSVLVPGFSVDKILALTVDATTNTYYALASVTFAKRSNNLAVLYGIDGLTDELTTLPEPADSVVQAGIAVSYTQQFLLVSGNSFPTPRFVNLTDGVMTLWTPPGKPLVNISSILIFESADKGIERITYATAYYVYFQNYTISNTSVQIDPEDYTVLHGLQLTYCPATSVFISAWPNSSVSNSEGYFSQYLAGQSPNSLYHPVYTNAILAFTNPYDPQYCGFWYQFDTGVFRSSQFRYPTGPLEFNKTTLSTSDVYLTMAYVPNSAIPFTRPSSGNTGAPTFSTTTPAFTLQSTNTQTGQQEETLAAYADFTVEGAQIQFPTLWSANSVRFVGDGTSSDLIDVSNTANTPSFSYVYTAPLTNSTTITFGAIYNPESAVTISYRDFTEELLPNTVKYHIFIEGQNVSAEIFNRKSTATLGWNNCFINDGALGAFNADYNHTTNGILEEYIFDRQSGGDSKLRVAYPNTAIVDNVTTTIPITLTAESLPSGSLQVCINYTFPHFNSSLFYDPDIGALVVDNSGDGTDGGGGDGASTPVAAIVAPVVVGSAMLCICCVCVIVAILIALAAYKRHRFQDVDFGGAVDV